ncbi:MAG: endopeptidase La [Anaerolineales bacterium]|jgi:ATP-dependent Lon protease
MTVYGRWPQMPPELGGVLNRRTEELFDVEDMQLDADGLITLPVLPLHDVVLYPSLLTPLFVIHENSLQAVEHAIRSHQTMIALALEDPELEEPGEADFFDVGTEVAVGRLMHLPDGSISIMTQGRRRLEVIQIYLHEGVLYARARPIPEISDRTKETVALMRAVQTLFEKCVELNRALPEEIYIYAVNLEEPGWLADLIASALNLSLIEQQELLETYDPIQRLQRISILLGRELDVLELEDQIHSQVQSEVDRSQREMYLREQMKAIQSELGEGDLWSQELDELRERITHLSLPEEVQERGLKELQRLQQMPPMSPEVGIIRTYLDWLTELPWTEATVDNLDIKHVASVLEEQHYALSKAKDRILEYIAVRSITPEKHKQPILCFVGPPGTGKTSLGHSIADALGRKFIRISLGGIRDEAEIRGHRRTYIGALPGRILQAMRRAGSINPLFMLDEIDKLGMDYRGDPSSALLEVLDPEQNFSFSDHYLEIPYDLSHVMFITTANMLDPIPPALLDRLEVIEFPGYIEEEKILIARKFLVPRQLEQNGLQVEELVFSEAALKHIIREYTWEAGVRNLEREIGKVCRRIVRRRAEGKKGLKRITAAALGRLLGPPQIQPPDLPLEDQIGAAIGLAWTENGGEILVVEALLIEGKGGLQITGQIGDVMQESAQAAFSYIKSLSGPLGIDPEIFEKTDIHIHVPEGSIPKDGPSAGITMAVALASALTGRPVHRNLGMSGEITLRGRVLPVGGVREKVHAAYRMKLEAVILPARNNKDLDELPRQARNALEIHLVESMKDVLDLALAPVQVKPKAKVKKKSATRTSKKRADSSASVGGHA